MLGSSESHSSLASRGRTASFSSITDSFPLLRTQREDREGKRNETQKEKLWALMASYLPSDVTSIQKSIVNHVEFSLASSRFDFNEHKAYLATARSVRDRLIESFNDTNAHFDAMGAKRVAYLSLEFLMGRSLQNALLNMDLESNYKKALGELGYELERLYEEEPDAALGNGGLGRLAACFLDSMATLDLPAWGYGIRYTYGIFKQLIRDGAQVEYPDRWLTFGNPWEIERVDVAYPVRFYGSVRSETLADGSERRVWEGGEVVVAVAYDNPIPGFDTFNTINLRLFRAAPSREFDLATFNTGDYMKAVEQRQRAETISSVLYPSDATHSGKELRLRQQYFFVSATLRDVVRRFKRMTYQQAHGGPTPGISYSSVSLTPDQWRRFSEKNALQLNDTHPTIGIPELMRVLVDEEGLEWNLAWAITQETFGYTNHTVLPEALERWSVDLLGHLLPRHLEIIYKINWHHLELVKQRFGDGNHEVISELSLVEEGPCKMIRMASLGIVGSHAVNGVAELHTELLKSDVFPHFYQLFPERFQNKTNGVTPRRWMNQCNPGLSSLVTKWLDSDAWLKNLDMLGGLRSVAEHPELQHEWMAVKKANKQRLADYIQAACGVKVSANALFDVQVKRIHEYKRQQMNALYCIHRYRWLKSLPASERSKVLPRVTVFGGKAAPAYEMAKRFIRLIHRIGNVVNNDPDIGDLYKVVFIPNYNVSLAEIICPASDISQHISTAGMEASGTSNMKFALSGGLIIGTMDGANVEIVQETDPELHFIFGALASEVPELRADRRTQKSSGRAAPAHCPELQGVIADLSAGKFGPLDDVGPILSTLEYGNDWYLVGHDFPSYLKAQEDVDRVYRQPTEWARRSILTVAGMGKFSTDRTIAEYARDIWRISACRRPRPVTDAMGKVRSFPQLVGADGGAAGGGSAVLGSSGSRSGTTSPGGGGSGSLGMELSGGEPSTMASQPFFGTNPVAVAATKVPGVVTAPGQPGHHAGGRHHGR